ncbi:unnamed protein product [Prorocentrum cordatum]|uniref:Peptidylprolyl isomerase n=1 Tax=Prorocentrum cordatum TaxID=2364126 RepID=A0ABN9UQV9_9DINO|nr:unnamed protein product [Polarella glacialis]
MQLMEESDELAEELMETVASPESANSAAHGAHELVEEHMETKVAGPVVLGPIPPFPMFGVMDSVGEKDAVKFAAYFSTGDGAQASFDLEGRRLERDVLLLGGERARWADAEDPLDVPRGPAMAKGEDWAGLEYRLGASALGALGRACDAALKGMKKGEEALLRCTKDYSCEDWSDGVEVTIKLRDISAYPTLLSRCRFVTNCSSRCSGIAQVARLPDTNSTH